MLLKSIPKKKPSVTCERSLIQINFKKKWRSLNYRKSPTNFIWIPEFNSTFVELRSGKRLTFRFQALHRKFTLLIIYKLLILPSRTNICIRNLLGCVHWVPLFELLTRLFTDSSFRDLALVLSASESMIKKIRNVTTQPVITCSKLIIETLEQAMKYLLG